MGIDLCQKDFKPDKSWKKINYLGIIIGFIIWELCFSFIILFSLLGFIILTIMFFLISLPLILWIPLYYNSVFFNIDKNFIKCVKGIWWKKTITIPYNRITHVDTSQGPIERLFGVGNILIYTPAMSMVEPMLFGIKNYNEIEDEISEKVRLAKLHTEPHGTLKTKPMGDIETKHSGLLLETQKEILNELKQIKTKLDK